MKNTIFCISQCTLVTFRSPEEWKLRGEARGRIGEKKIAVLSRGWMEMQDVEGAKGATLAPQHKQAFVLRRNVSILYTLAFGRIGGNPSKSFLLLISR